MIDFGLCSMLRTKEEELNTTIGSPFYVSKEVLNGKYKISCDMWAMGVMMYAMLAGRYPFNGNDNDALFKNIVKGEFDISKSPWDKISNEGKDLVNRLLSDEKVRLTADGAYNHVWFNKVDQ
jgi:serine/threonine protein kinase